jgi:hypothetical protein
MTAQLAINYHVCMYTRLDLFTIQLPRACASSQNDIPAALAIALK